MIKKVPDFDRVFETKITGNEDIDYWKTVRDEVRVCYGMKRMMEAGVNPHRITILSDGQESLPVYNEKGEFQGMGVGQ